MTERGRIAAAARDARAGVIEQPEHIVGARTPGIKTRKTVEVEYRWTFYGPTGWKRYWRRYATVEIARAMIERENRKNRVMEFRLKDHVDG